jgi:hypothetical protein
MKSPATPNNAEKRRAFRLRNYQVEVINKCTGRQAAAENPDQALYYLIGLHVPEPIIMSALESVQDARLRNRDPQQPTINNLAAYYVATVKSKCAENGIETPIRWSVESCGPVTA